jgi:hypothetical protein
VLTVNAELIPALNSTAVLGAFVRPLLVVWLLAGLWLALARASLPLRRRTMVWSAVAVFLIAWAAVVWTLALAGVFELVRGAHPRSWVGLILGSDVVLIGTALTLCVRSKSIAAAIDAAPAWWLVSYQGYRVAGFIFVRLWAAGILPGSFALPAGIGDTVTGIAAVGTAIALWRNARWARTLAYGVNLFGIADLLNAIILGAVNTSSAVGPWPLLGYPLAIVPTFGVPLAFLVHCLSLWQLHRRGHPERQPEGITA